MSSGHSKFRPATRPVAACYLHVLLCVFAVCLASGSAQTSTEPDLTLDPGVSQPGYAFRSTKNKPAVEPADDSRALEVGDKVSFRIAEDDDPSVVLAVASSGEIEFPLAGRVRAAGRTCKDVAAEVKRRLDSKYYRDATISLALESETQAPLGKFFVSGQVQRQGPIEIMRGEKMTVAGAILNAGGFADFADRRRVRLIRPGPDGKSETFKIDVKAVLEKGDVSKDLEVRPGDFILVPERMFNF